MDNDPYIIAARKSFETFAEHFSDCIRLAWAMISAPIKVLYNFITRNENGQR